MVGKARGIRNTITKASTQERTSTMPPVTASLPDPWYETPNIHFCTIKDFIALCDTLDAKVQKKIAVNAQGRQVNLGSNVVVANLLAKQAVFLLQR